eukprot:CAMPEP_0175639908 /NCGR_PEP_ID=MMETSP0097-20121207/3976_1 /TAXON_ID=311494 /ORGANISM="Alexandrium monilatum, Strain CCMP3105" /LENGTH=63 /DNA_ID=CAMNT_0016945645 /DNA_START=230 /DNA_END=421 /DNA_ORIENTATION=-
MKLAISGSSAEAIARMRRSATETASGTTMVSMPMRDYLGAALQAVCYLPQERADDGALRAAQV